MGLEFLQQPSGAAEPGKAKGLGEGLRSSRAEHGRARILKDGIPLSLCPLFSITTTGGGGGKTPAPLYAQKMDVSLSKRHSVSLRGGFSPKK